MTAPHDTAIGSARPGWNPETLNGRTVLVTGGARGIGRACVDRCLEAGARVASVDRSHTDAAPSDASTERLALIEADVTTEAGADRAVAAATGALGPMHVLVNNVGGMADVAAVPLQGLTPEEWDELMGLNLRPTFLVTRAVLRRHEAGELSAIVNIGASLSERSSPHLSAYGAAKAAVAQLTRTLAVELGPSGVRVNCVAPGFTTTPAAAHVVSDARRDATAAAVPLGRVASPVEMADVVVFLASELASFVSGQTIVIDGGLLSTTLRAPRGWRDLGAQP